MSGVTRRVLAKVRHEPDRSYALLVEAPGDVEVGNTRLTSRLREVAREGAAQLWHLPLCKVEVERLVVPQPPYGQDGQLVRLIWDEVPENRGAVGQAHWFAEEAAWSSRSRAAGRASCPARDWTSHRW